MEANTPEGRLSPEALEAVAERARGLIEEHSNWIDRAVGTTTELNTHFETFNREGAVPLADLRIALIDNFRLMALLAGSVEVVEVSEA